MASTAPSSSGKGVAVWTLITGLAVGFAIGRESGGGGTKSGEDEAPSKTASAGSGSTGTKAPSRVYKSQADFPPTWLKEADLAAVPNLKFDGLTDAQKVVALQAINERDCECGCGMGSIANCAKKDPNCPRSPVLARMAVEDAKAGKSLTDVLAALDQKQKDLAGGKAAPTPAEPSGPKKIALTDYSPRKGPKAAKVTIVEWSDFQ